MPPGDASSRLDELNARVGELERRISALEHHRGAQPALPHPHAVPPEARLLPGETPSSQPQLSVLSIFGRCVLGIAGAYLLRALAESGSIPPWIPLAIGVVYATCWLLWAARPGAGAGLARPAYAITSALILAPMLWEATARFRIVAPTLTAGILAAFAVLAMVLAVRRQAPWILWVGTLAAALSSLLLMVATRDLLPFAWALLALALAGEFGGVRGRWLALRAVIAGAADVAALIVVVVLGDLQAIPPEYHAPSRSALVALVAALFAFYAAGLALRSLVIRLRIRITEAAQFAVAALLAGWAVLRITGGTGLAALGVWCLALGAACYAAAFGLLARRRERPNFHFYAACGIILVTLGSFFELPAAALVIWLCVAAGIATGIGVNVRSPVLELHGVVYLSGAVYASGLLGYAGGALAGAAPAAPEVLPTVAAAAALLCAGMVSGYRGERPGERLLRLLPAILGAYAAAGIGVAALVVLMAHGAALTLPQLAVVRTAVTCVVALLLAFLGARFRRAELVWLAYGAAALGSLKLVFEDLRLGSAWALASSLLIYGAVLMAIPLVVRGRARGSEPAVRSTR